MTSSKRDIELTFFCKQGSCHAFVYIKVAGEKKIHFLFKNRIRNDNTLNCLNKVI